MTEATPTPTPPEASTCAADAPKTLPAVLRRFVAYPSPRILLALAPVAVTARIAAGPFTLWDLGIALAVFAAWPAVEWCIHVFVLHFRPLPLGGRLWDPKVSQKHRAHHREPWRADLVFIPPHTFGFSIPLIGGLWALSGEPALALTGIASTLAMGLHYEWVHHLVHTRYVPKTRLYHHMWRPHRLHHMKNEQYWFGVTTRLADRVLATDGEPDAVPTSATARTII